MKLIYIANARIPTEKAHGNQIMKMCEQFAKNGLAVELVIATRKNPLRADPFSYHQVAETFSIKRIYSLDLYRLASFITERGAFYLQSLTFLVSLFFWFAKLDRQDIVYTRMPSVVWLARFFKIRACYEGHEWFGRNEKISLWFLKKVFKIVVTNRFLAEQFEKRGFTKDKIMVAPNGVDLTVFDLSLDKSGALDSLSWPAEIKNKIRQNFTLVYTGSFKTMGVDKGITDLLKALALLPPQIFFFLAVGGSEADIIFYRGLAQKNKVNDQCGFLPRQSKTDLALAQKVADVLVMPFPRRAHYEFFMSPLKTFEYLVAKRPILASDLPSLREVLNEQNAFFVPPEDPAAIAKALVAIKNNPDLAKQKVTQAFQDAHHYTWEQRATKIIQFIIKDNA